MAVGDAGDVEAVAEREQREERRARRARPRAARPSRGGSACCERLRDLVGQLEPERGGLERGGRQLERLGAEQLLAAHAPALVAGHARRDLHAAEAQPEVARRARALAREDARSPSRRARACRWRRPRARTQTLRSSRSSVVTRHGARVVQVDRALVALGEDVSAADRFRFSGARLPPRLEDLEARAGRAQAHGAVGRAARGEPLAAGLAAQQLGALFGGLERARDGVRARATAPPRAAGARRRRRAGARPASSAFSGSSTACSKPRSKKRARVRHQVLVERVGHARRARSRPRRCGRPGRRAARSRSGCPGIRPGCRRRGRRRRCPARARRSRSRRAASPSNSLRSISRRSSGRKPAR